MSQRDFNSTKVPRANPAFPQAVIAGNLIFLSGTTGIDASTGKLPATYLEQATNAFKNIVTILEEAGSGADKVIKTTIFMVAGVDPDFSIINRLYTEYFPSNAPARSVPQVNPFPGGILISIECIAGV